MKYANNSPRQYLTRKIRAKRAATPSMFTGNESNYNSSYIQNTNETLASDLGTITSQFPSSKSQQKYRTGGFRNLHADLAGHTLHTITDAVVEKFNDRPSKLKHHLPFRVFTSNSSPSGIKKVRKIKNQNDE